MDSVLDDSNAKTKNCGFCLQGHWLQTGSQMMAFYLNCPVFANVFGPNASRLKPHIIHSTDFTHLYYLPSTVTAASDDDKSLAIFKWKSGMTTVGGNQCSRNAQVRFEAREPLIFFYCKSRHETLGLNLKSDRGRGNEIEIQDGPKGIGDERRGIHKGKLLLCSNPHSPETGCVT